MNLLLVILAVANFVFLILNALAGNVSMAIVSAVGTIAPLIALAYRN